jgi:hypothetical protein
MSRQSDSNNGSLRMIPAIIAGQSRRFGSLAAAARSRWDVRFAPESGHRIAGAECPLSANRRHRADIQNLLKMAQSSRHIRIDFDPLRRRGGPELLGFGMTVRPAASATTATSRKACTSRMRTEALFQRNPIRLPN